MSVQRGTYLKRGEGYLPWMGRGYLPTWDGTVVPTSDGREGIPALDGGEYTYLGQGRVHTLDGGGYIYLGQGRVGLPTLDGGGTYPV